MFDKKKFSIKKSPKSVNMQNLYRNGLDVVYQLIETRRMIYNMSMFFTTLIVQKCKYTVFLFLQF